MPRANRYYHPGYVWHITHRCHKQEFLLRFDKDKKRWIQWLFEAKKRFGLCVLNYMVTSNHIHLLIYENKKGTIPKSLQLLAGRVGQEYNIRKKRKGAFWEDRYHATVIDGERYFVQCMVYIDLNMVRAGVVKHPMEWKYCGYKEIMNPKDRYTIVDREVLMKFFRTKNFAELQNEYEIYIQNELKKEDWSREPEWSSSIAIGSENFISEIQNKLGITKKKSKIGDTQNNWILHEPGAS